MRVRVHACACVRVRVCVCVCVCVCACVCVRGEGGGGAVAERTRVRRRRRRCHSASGARSLSLVVGDRDLEVGEKARDDLIVARLAIAHKVQLPRRGREEVREGGRERTIRGHRVHAIRHRASVDGADGSDGVRARALGGSRVDECATRPQKRPLAQNVAQ